MDKRAIDEMLAATLEDHKLSRGERHALKEVVQEQGLDHEGYAFWRNRAFSVAREMLAGEENFAILAWLEDVVRLLHPVAPGSPGIAKVRFSPGPACLDAIREQLHRAQRSVDICVFTITDDRLAEAILEARARGVAVRIATDDEKSHDRGSDVMRLAQAGIETRVDRSRHHMHHKFAVFDAASLVTGSYNWTRSAAEHNQENVLVTDDARLVVPYREMFDRIWDRLDAL